MTQPKFAKLAACVALAAILVGCGAANAATAGGGAVDAPEIAPLAGNAAGVEQSKEEVVYANLSAGGGVKQVYVVNRFEVASPGTLTDRGRYASVENLTTTALLTQTGDTVSVPVQAGDFIYQGNLESTELPWIFNISYQLDGAPVSAEELAGKSGKVEIGLTTRPNPNADETFCDNYLLQISLTLDASKSTGIASENATIANAGKNKIITHTVMPGKDGDITVAADAAEFEMAGIEIAAMPFSMAMDLPDTGGMTGEMVTLADAVGALAGGVAQLADGVDELNSGTGQIVDGSADFAAGLAALSANSARLVGGSAEINGALGQINSALSEGMGGDISLQDIAQLPAALRQLADGMQQAAGGMVQLSGQYSAMYSRLNGAIMDIPDGTLTVTEQAALTDAANEKGLDDALEHLLANYKAAQNVKDVYTDASGGVSIQTAFADIAASLGASATLLEEMADGLKTAADEIEAALAENNMLAQIGQLTDGLSALAQNYGDFHAGLVEYTNGVDQLSTGYRALHGGLEELHGGTGELAGGARALAGGASLLNNAVSGLPDTIELEIDKLMEDYDTSDFTPVSFASKENAAPALVQFVFMTEAISAEKDSTPVEQEEAPSSLWERLTALFQ